MQQIVCSMSCSGHSEIRPNVELKCESVPKWLRERKGCSWKAICQCNLLPEKIRRFECGRRPICVYSNMQNTRALKGWNWQEHVDDDCGTSVPHAGSPIESKNCSEGIPCQLGGGCANNCSNVMQNVCIVQGGFDAGNDAPMGPS